MEASYAAPDLAILDTTDRIARAAHLWLRQHAISSGTYCTIAGSVNNQRRARLLVAGFLFELCDVLELTVQQGLFAAYAYALLDGSDEPALQIAEILLDARTTQKTSIVFEEGRSLAGEMLGLLEHSGLKSSPEDHSGWFTARYSC